MAGAKNKRKRKELKAFMKERQQVLELRALMTDRPVARELAGLYDKALHRGK